MTAISPKELNNAWKAYRQYHTYFREFDFGPAGFVKFLDVDKDLFHKWIMTPLNDNEFPMGLLTPMAVGRINVLNNSSPENAYTLLRAVAAKYSTEETIETG